MSQDHEKDRVDKYAPYFKDNIILPIPELVTDPVLHSDRFEDPDTGRT